MANHLNITFKPPTYTRVDFTALRAWVQRVPISTIADRYYNREAPQVKQGLENFLSAMRDDLIERASTANPHIASILRSARQGGTITETALRIIFEASNAKPGEPSPEDPLAQWFRPRVAKALLSENMVTLHDVVTRINRYGYHWWRPIPRLGQRGAGAVIAWLQRHEKVLGKIEAHALAPEEIDESYQVLVDVSNQQLAPLERIALPYTLDGSQGYNRAKDFSFIRATNDLEAIRAYLARYEPGGNTFKKYQKELERYLLWCILVTGKPISSQFVEDCEAYKEFLKAPRPDFVGPRKPRLSAHWKPFNEEPLKDSSRKAAIQCIRACCEWLTKVRYLSGNPWVAVTDPETITPLNPMQIEKALPFSLWEKLVSVAQQAAKQPENQQSRIELAAMLLMGDSGLRREEAATATSDQLRPSSHATGVWELNVLGKRRKWRTVPVSKRTFEALQAHWSDRHPGIEMDLLPAPLLSPITTLQTKASLEKHGHLEEMPYAAAAIYPLIKSLIKKVIDIREFDDAEEAALLRVSPHAFRHTFGTQAVAKGVPVDVAQKVLGHASVSTTSIYVQAEKERTMAEAKKFFEKLG